MCSLRPEPWVDPINHSEAAVKLSELLFSALGNVLPRCQGVYRQSVDSYWGKQEREVVPACVVRPQRIK